MKHLLIIDDEPFVRDALKRVLESEAVTVHTAPDADTRHPAAQPAYGSGIVDVIMPARTAWS